MVDEKRIVDVQESLAECAAKHEQDGEDQKTADGDRPPGVGPVFGSRAGRRLAIGSTFQAMIARFRAADALAAYRRRCEERGGVLS